MAENGEWLRGMVNGEGKGEENGEERMVRREW